MKAANLVLMVIHGMSIFSQGQGAEEERGDVARLRRTSDDEGNAEIGKKRRPSI